VKPGNKKILNVGENELAISPSKVKIHSMDFYIPMLC